VGAVLLLLPCSSQPTEFPLASITNELYGPSLWQAVIRELVRNQREVERQFWGAKQAARLNLAGVCGGRPADIPAASERYWLAEYRDIASAPSGSAAVPAPAASVPHPAAAPAAAAAAGHGSCAPMATAASTSNMLATAAAAATHGGTNAPPASTATAAAACVAAGQSDGGCARSRGETQSPFATLCLHTAVQLRLLLEVVTCKRCTCVIVYQQSHAHHVGLHCPSWGCRHCSAAAQCAAPAVSCQAGGCGASEAGSCTASGCRHTRVRQRH